MGKFFLTCFFVPLFGLGKTKNIVDSFRVFAKPEKNAWVAGNESIAVYTAMNSGPPQMITVTRMKGGLKELDPSFRKTLPER